MEEDRRISGLMILFSLLLHGGDQGLGLRMAYFGVLLRNGLGVGGTFFRLLVTQGEEIFGGFLDGLVSLSRFFVAA